MEDQQQQTKPQQPQEEPPLKWIKTSSHPNHTLKEVLKNSEFKCQLCKTKGTETRYRCDPCNFDIHTGCTTCPDILPSSIHHNHELVLMPKPGFIHKCSLCRGFVRSKVYRCRECKFFFLHPLCSQFPSVLHSHPKHPLHSLRLVVMTKSKKCDVCEKKCRNWRYFCEGCDVHVHVGCLSREKIGGDRVLRKLASEILKEVIFNSTISF